MNHKPSTSFEMSSNIKEDASPADELYALEQQWTPALSDDDYYDDDDDVLPSFADIKAKTMRDLYGGIGGNDKSPKGSVDEAIRPLVSLLNIHPAFATLSSCSGRIALFDPHMKHATTGHDTLDLEDSVATIESSGKGYGGWLLASHEEVEPPSTLATLLWEEEEGSAESGESLETLVFKHEPLLLHVAAVSLRRGRQLLSLALQLGFRESGLVVTPHRVTVAIRGHSLALCVPLARHGPLRPCNEYLENLVQEANTRMRSNQEKLKRLQQHVQDEFFRPATKSLCATVKPLPALNLWGHAAVAAPVGSSSSDYDLDVLVFGGYGEGPDMGNGTVQGGNSGGGKRCCRSNRVYCLRRRDHVFEDQWREVSIMPVRKDTNEPRVYSLVGVDVTPGDLSPREGLGACLLPIHVTRVNVVALFGGRASPGKPYNDLLLYETYGGMVNPRFMKPLDVRGECPEPRWGHSFMAIPENGESTDECGPVAVLIGGRNETTSFGSIHMLSISIRTYHGMRHFYWTKLELGFPPHFNHTAVVVPEESDSIVIVFGGLSDPNHLLESFSDSFRSKHKGSSKELIAPCISAFRIVGRDDDAIVVQKVHVVVNNNNNNHASGESFGMRHGAASCVLTAPDMSGRAIPLVALTGGVPFNNNNSNNASSEAQSLVWYQLKMSTTANEITLVPRRDIQIVSADTIGFGAMVHHCCLPLLSPVDYADMILIGGGVSSFSFGTCFAGCHYVGLGLDAAAATNHPATKAVGADTSRILPKHSTAGKEQTTSVLYVTTRNAKALKTALEESKYLDKNFRMTKADGSLLQLENNPATNHIAVPVTNECWAALDEQINCNLPAWYSLVVAKGKQQVPFSTALLGRQKK